MRIFTIGYGGRTPGEFLDLLVQSGVRTVVDVRIEPGRAFMRCYAFARTPDKGIQALLTSRNIQYVSMPELGNPFRHDVDWPARYERLLQSSGDQLLAPLLAATLEAPLCLLCAEKNPAQCHRGLIATFLERRGHATMHIM
jgi:uncharacterized protein (DUF488 family)